jgi:hypothetical protein
VQHEILLIIFNVQCKALLKLFRNKGSISEVNLQSQLDAASGLPCGRNSSKLRWYIYNKIRIPEGRLVEKVVKLLCDKKGE